MFLVKEEYRLHALTKDMVARLLFLNAFFVIAGYALANATGGILVSTVSNFKNVFLFLSFAYLIVRNKIVNPLIFFDSGFTPIIFGFLILYISIGTGSDSKSYFKVFTFFVPLIYVYLSLAYLILNFGIELTLKGLHYSLIIIYCVPIISYIISGGSIRDTNIYGGGSEDQFFASNNYGWSATMYLLSYLFVWRDIQIKKFTKIFLGVLVPIAFILLLASANRASWLSVSVAFIPFFFNYKKIKLIYKIVFVLVIFGFVTYFLSDPNSSINFAKSKSYKQEQVGEARFETAGVMIRHFNDEPTLWLTGVGMFNFEYLKNKDVLHAYHNSYYEVLFGAGIPLFLLFMSFMFFRPVSRFVKYYSKYTLLLPPLIILPFFESDLTGGQFLFFPWFTFMLLLNAKTKFWNKETFEAHINKRRIIADEDAVVNQSESLSTE